MAKPINKQHDRAVDDMTARVRKCLNDSAPIIQAKYQLPEELLRLVMYAAVARVAIECGKVAGTHDQDEQLGERLEG